MEAPDELIESILYEENFEDAVGKDASNLDEVRAALRDMLKEIDKIERGDETSALRFAYKVDNFVNMNPALKVQMYFFNMHGGK